MPKCAFVVVRKRWLLLLSRVEMMPDVSYGTCVWLRMMRNGGVLAAGAGERHSGSGDTGPPAGGGGRLDPAAASQDIL